MHQTFSSFAIKIPLYRIGQIFSIKVITDAQVNLWHFTGVFLKSMYCFINLIPIPNSQGPVVRWKDVLITKHIVSMKLVGLTPVFLTPFPYEFEIPADPSMYPGSGGNSRTGSPPVVQFVGFLARIRFTPPQGEKVLLMDDIQLFRKIKLRLNHY